MFQRNSCEKSMPWSSILDGVFKDTADMSKFIISGVMDKKNGIF